MAEEMLILSVMIHDSCSERPLFAANMLKDANATHQFHLHSCFGYSTHTSVMLLMLCNCDYTAEGHSN